MKELTLLDVANRWAKIVSAYEKTRIEADVIGRWPDLYVVHDWILRSSFSLVFIQAYTLLDDLGLSHNGGCKKCLHSPEIKKCCVERNKIAHEVYLINQSSTKELINVICEELKNKNYLPKQTENLR